MNFYMKKKNIQCINGIREGEWPARILENFKLSEYVKENNDR